MGLSQDTSPTSGTRVRNPGVDVFFLAKLNLQTHLHSVEDETQPSASYVFNGSVDVFFGEVELGLQTHLHSISDSSIVA